MSVYDFSKEHYFFELERKNQLTSSLSMPVGVLVLLIGAVTFFASSFVFKSDVLSLCLAGLLICASGMALFTVWQLFRSYWSYEYHYLETPDKHVAYFNQLVDYYSQVESQASATSALAEFERELTQSYSEAASANARNNSHKSAALHQANTGLVGVVIFVSLSAPLFYFGPKRPQQPVFNHKEVIMSADQDSTDKKADQPATPAPAPDSIKKPVKPLPPKNVKLREGQGLDKPGKGPLNE